MSPIVNPLPFLFIIATTLGVVMHDTQVDKATTVAVTNPAQFANYVSADAASKSNDHVHVERVSMNYNANAVNPDKVPKIQPRNDHIQYVQVKKRSHSDGDSDA